MAKTFMAGLVTAVLALAAENPPPRADRSVAEWVLHVRGSVSVDDDPHQIWDAANLPARDFRLHTINLVPVVVEPRELNRLTGLTHLEKLYLCGRTWHSMPTEVAKNTLTYFQGLTSLKTLVLSLPVQTEIPLEDDAIAAISSLTNLTELRLAQTKVKGRTLSPFTRLQSLDLDHTRFDDKGMQNLEGMTQLSKLYLRDTLITDEGLKYLGHLRHLTELDLYGTKIT